MYKCIHLVTAQKIKKKKNNNNKLRWQKEKELANYFGCRH